MQRFRRRREASSLLLILAATSCWLLLLVGHRHHLSLLVPVSAWQPQSTQRLQGSNFHTRLFARRASEANDEIRSARNRERQQCPTEEDAHHYHHFENNTKASNNATPRTKQPSTVSQQPAALMSRSIATGFVALSCLFVSLGTAAVTPASASDAAHLTTGKRYYTIQEEGTDQERIMANTALMDYAVGTVSTMYYDHTAGVTFNQREFFHTYRSWLESEKNSADPEDQQHKHALSTRQGVVEGLQWLMRDVLHDPYSKYLTREELRAELSSSPCEGFLGLGAMVEAPTAETDKRLGIGSSITFPPPPPTTTTTALLQTAINNPGNSNVLTGNKHGASTAAGAPSWLTAAQVQSLPVVTAVTPNSPAERSGITVGDRIVAVGQDSFLTVKDAALVKERLETKYSAENYLGHPDLTIAKPVYASYPVTLPPPNDNSILTVSATNSMDPDDGDTAAAAAAPPVQYRDVVRAFRPQRVRLATVAAAPVSPYKIASSTLTGGDALVQYELLTQQNSIFHPLSLSMSGIVTADVDVDDDDSRLLYQGPVDVVGDKDDSSSSNSRKEVGYIRLTRFSRASTAAFLRAVDELEAAGASSYIIDLRNNYGGVIQEAMLTAASLLRDPHTVLTYTMNSRGGFTPHDVEEYVLDKRYPGYLLSRESPSVTRNQVMRESPELFENDMNWSPMSSYASIHEQKVKRGLHLPSTVNARKQFVNGGITAELEGTSIPMSQAALEQLQSLAAQKNIVLLINEGTASSAEVFASALHDNGRTVALVGTKTYGKGLVQHTFPLPDGGGLRLTVAEYLTPALHHVTHVGDAQYDRVTGEWIGGGIHPDLVCDSRQGIPSNVGADLCVGLALDALEEADSTFQESGMLAVKRLGGVDDGSKVRRAVQMGVVKDDF